MKAKPDLSSFRAGKDPTDFLEGGAGDRSNRVPSEKPHQDVQPAKPEPTVQKLFRFRWDTAQALKRGVVDQSESSGSRVTETEIVEALVRAHFRLPKL